MKLHYYPETDTLSIELVSKAGADAREIADGVVADFDAKGNIIAIDIDIASKRVDLKKLDILEFPVPAKRRVPRERNATLVAK